jgi:FkbM family methyltransferase
MLLWLRKPRRQRNPVLRPFYKILLNHYCYSKSPIKAKLHGFELLLNPGNTYPFIIQDAPLFNAPLVELVYQMWKAKGSPVRLVDVGAACGDSVLLIKEKCPKQVGEFVCVEGDAEFFQILSQNMAQFDNVRLEQALLSDKPDSIHSLIKHHQGSATAQGEGRVPAVPLDQLSEKWQGAIDILKTDVDGFDGKVLAGAKTTLLKHRPAVIFEWHPKLTVGCGNDPSQAFEVLQSCGYNRFLWFNNNGTFSHFSESVPVAMLKKNCDYLLGINSRGDEHFDVIALNDNTQIDDVALAMTKYYRQQQYSI